MVCGLCNGEGSVACFDCRGGLRATVAQCDACLRTGRTACPCSVSRPIKVAVPKRVAWAWKRGRADEWRRARLAEREAKGIALAGSGAGGRGGQLPEKPPKVAKVPKVKPLPPAKEIRPVPPPKPPSDAYLRLSLGLPPPIPVAPMVPPKALEVVEAATYKPTATSSRMCPRCHSNHPSAVITCPMSGLAI